MLKRIAFAALAFAFLATPARATQSIVCEGTGGSDTSVDVLIGSLPVLGVLTARIEAGGQMWSTEEEKGATLITFGQGARFGDRTIMDFTDPNIEGIVISVRLQSATVGSDTIEVGTLTIPGVGVWGLTCVPG